METKQIVHSEKPSIKVGMNVLNNFVGSLKQKKEFHKSVDQLEADLLNNFPVVDVEINHHFSEGLYAREMIALAGTFIISKIHKTEHMFYLSKGALNVMNENGEVIKITAPYRGITKPGTRRIAYVTEDVIWTTYHANPDNENEEEIENRIIEKHDNFLLTQEVKQQLAALYR